MNTTTSTSENRYIPMYLDCPHCKHLRGVGLNREMLEDFEAGKIVSVYSAVCSHDWLLTEEQANNARKAIARGEFNSLLGRN